jgi:class 3 adenylate cyclase
MIDIALAAEEIELAGEWVEVLAEIADAYESQVWTSAADFGRGGVEFHKGKFAVAVEHLDRSWRSYNHLDLPYEMALARTLLGEAKRALGDESGANMELKAALATLRQLGAANEAARVSKVIGGDDEARATPKRVTRTFMFTDIVTSTDLIELIGDSAWQDLLEWHDRTLRRSIEAAGGELVRHTGDGYFASFSATRPALDCAVDINRRLHRHRRDAGFAPQVRIGIHRTDANRTGSDYSGRGIHLAARIMSHGTADQIVVSSGTLDDAGAIPYGYSEPEEVDLKGISELVEVRNIDWRQ